MPSRSGTSAALTTEARLHDPEVVGPQVSADALRALLEAEHGDPFALLGPHQDAQSRWWLRALLPGAQTVTAVEAATGRTLAVLDRVHADGLFSGRIPRRRKLPDYRLCVQWSSTIEIETVDDPYRYGPLLGELDLWLLAEGTELRPGDKLGAHAHRIGESHGTRFAVWAPSAQRVAVVGDWNMWDERRHPLRRRVEAGIWEIYIPGVGPGARYKFAILEATGRRGPWRADPYARECELRPATASVVAAALPQPQAYSRPATHGAPLAIYEVHLGSWQRVVEEHDRWLNWDELAETLIPYTVEMGFTHLELLPVTEHPLDASWGYQPIGLYAPTARFGSPAGFLRFVERCHDAGLGLILDWVPGHFPADEHGLARFDGTHLFEHADPREGTHPDWKTLIYNFGRHEVQAFLVGNARYWLEHFGVDGLRVDAVASMLYRDYSRGPGEWTQNAMGGRENLEAIAFLQRLNTDIGAFAPQALTVAEESTSWPGVSAPTASGGLGFHYKWNMGWMNDTLRYMARDPIHRSHHHNELTFGLLYAFDEQFVLPLSHDEVVHGKGSLLSRMPGDRRQQFANLRLYFGFMYAHPGKKLLFMGGEFAQVNEWNHAQSLDWHLLEDPMHGGVQTLIRDLNRLYRMLPALHALDCERAGFNWITHDDHATGIIAFTRLGRAEGERLIAVCNFTPVARSGYRLGVPREGGWRECFNSDSAHYGGTNLGNAGSRLSPQAEPAHGYPFSLELTVPPLATLYLQWIP